MFGISTFLKWFAFFVKKKEKVFDPLGTSLESKQDQEMYLEHLSTLAGFPLYLEKYGITFIWEKIEMKKFATLNIILTNFSIPVSKTCKSLYHSFFPPVPPIM